MGKILQIVRYSNATILFIFGTKTKDFSLHPLPFYIAFFRVYSTHFIPLHHQLLSSESNMAEMSAIFLVFGVLSVSSQQTVISAMSLCHIFPLLATVYERHFLLLLIYSGNKKQFAFKRSYQLNTKSFQLFEQVL